MTSIDPTGATAAAIAHAVASQSMRSVDVLDALLARMDAINPAINAVVALDIDRARAACEAADAAVIAGDIPLGPLHGVPITIKDVWETEGLVTTSGAPELAAHLPAADAVGVARLKAAGAIVFGKTNVPLWAGDDQTFNEVYGRTNNPWDLGRTTSGSSGGAAAAVATGITPIEFGSDIGGSIRTPAHACGVYGLKPSWGVIPSRGHIPFRPGALVENDVNCGGPLARSVEDLRLGLDILAGPLDENAIGWRLDLPIEGPAGGWWPASSDPSSSQTLDGLRVAITLTDERFPVASDVQQSLRAFADRLTDAGAAVTETPLPVSVFDGFRSWQDLVLPQIGAMLSDEHVAAFAGLEALDAGDDIMLRSGQGLVLRWRDVLRADQHRQTQRQAWAAHFTNFDVVLAPPMATTAFPHDTERDFPSRVVEIDGVEFAHTDLTAWPGAIGAMLLPVVVLPTGRTEHTNLPVGVQVIGPYLRDRWLLDVAARLDAVAGRFAQPPI